MNGGTPAGAPLRTPTQSPARKKQKPRSPIKDKTTKAARASGQKRSHKSPRDAQVVKQQYKNMRIWEMLERYGVITDCKDLNSLEKFIKAGQLGAVTQAKHLEQMSAALKDRADQFDRRIEEVNKRIAEYNQMKQQEQIELRRLQGLQQPSEQLTMYLESQDTVINWKDARIKALDGTVAPQNKLIAQQQREIELLRAEIDSRKCSGCGKQKQDVEGMYSLCCLCCHPIRPGQSIEEALASCKER